MSRAIWTGSIRLSHLEVPVTAHCAVDSHKSRSCLHKLHCACHGRVRQKTMCPLHGDLSGDEIVMGYQHRPGQFTVLDRCDLDELQSASDRAIAMDKFVPPCEIDPIYFAGKSYYLLPCGLPAQIRYSYLLQAMIDKGVWGIARMFLHRRDRLMVVRPLEGVLTMSQLHFADSIRPVALFDPQLSPGQSASNMEQVRRLIDTIRAQHAGLKEYRDPYPARLAALIEAKTGAKEIGERPVGERKTIGKEINSFRSAQKQRTVRPATFTTTSGTRILSQRPLRLRKGRP